MQASGSLIALNPGILASPAELSNLTAAALAAAMDKIMDNPGFCHAIGDACVLVG